MNAGVLGALRAAVGQAHVLVDGDLAAWELDWRKRWRGKALAGTLLGYGSVVLFLLVAIVAKLAWPALQKALHGG